jgi:hypothetical protein
MESPGMKYRVLITKTLDVPKNLLHLLFDSEEEAVKAAKEKLVELDGDVAVVSRLAYGDTRVIHRFEKGRKGGEM